MTNPFYNPTGNPGSGAAGLSAIVRAEFTNIAAGFAFFPTVSGNNNRVVLVNSGGTGFSLSTGQFAIAGNFSTTGAFNTVLAQAASITLTLPGVSGTVATLAGTETLTNKTLVAPALGTPASGVATNLTGTASGLTAGHATLATTAVNVASGGSVSAYSVIVTAPLGPVSTQGAINIHDSIIEPVFFNGFVLYIDSGDGKLKAKASSGTVTILASP